MVFPNLPTDSIYKFVFVGGLALTIISYVVLSVKIENYNRLSNEIDLQQIRVESQYENINNTLSFINEMYTSELTPHQRGILDEKLENIEKISPLLNNGKTETDVKVSHFEIATEELEKYKFLSYSIIALGIVLSVLSGYLWYHKLQKFQDMMIVLEYNNLNKK